MIARAARLGMGLGRFSRQLRGVEVLAMPDVGLDTTQELFSKDEGVEFGTGIVEAIELPP